MLDDDDERPVAARRDLTPGQSWREIAGVVDDAIEQQQRVDNRKQQHDQAKERGCEIGSVYGCAVHQTIHTASSSDCVRRALLITYSRARNRCTSSRSCQPKHVKNCKTLFTLAASRLTCKNTVTAQ